MSREYPRAPLVGVGAVIVNAGRVVVIKRGRPPLQGEWSIPGGVVELGETVREAAAREALEETGLVVDVGGSVGTASTIVSQPASGPGSVLGVFDRIVWDEVGRDEAGRVRFHYVLIDVLCRVVSGELRAGADAAEARWLTREELEGFPLEEAARAVLRDGLKRGGG
jgi:8-oxo-dGTP diphosphatase